MSRDRLAIWSVTIALLVLSGVPSAAQPSLPVGPEILMHPQYDRRQPVSPIFEGWYRNPDGTYTLSFGYFNRNAEEDLEIPLGPENYIEPAEHDGIQPTSFPTGEDIESLSIGRGWGVFGITVPADFPRDGEIVWTLVSKGATHSVPGRINSPEYRLSDLDRPVGNGSMPPRVRFGPDGEVGLGPKGVMAQETTSGRVGEPITLTVTAEDNFDPSRWEAVPIDLRWHKYQGPPEGQVEFGYYTESDPAPEENAGFGGNRQPVLRTPVGGGEVSTTATFSAPGEYVLRVEAGNFSARDSSNSNQCCWTNGYVRVNVTP